MIPRWAASQEAESDDVGTAELKQMLDVPEHGHVLLMSCWPGSNTGTPF